MHNSKVGKIRIKNCSDETIRKLMVLATEAGEIAYVPFTKFKDGAAALTRRGVMSDGRNIENAVCRLGVCAEQVALANAHLGKDKDTDIVVIAIEADMDVPCPPLWRLPTSHIGIQQGNDDCHGKSRWPVKNANNRKLITVLFFK